MPKRHIYNINYYFGIKKLLIDCCFFINKIRSLFIAIILIVFIFFLNNKSFAQTEVWTSYSSLNDPTCIALENNKIWIGTKGGMLLRDYEGNLLKEYRINDGLINNNISCIAIDKNGNKWVGSHAGISKFDGKAWENYTILNSGLISNYIDCITTDKYGGVWIGTLKGVSCFNGTKWLNYTEENTGLHLREISSITIDANGIKWITTSHDLFSFDNQNWEKHYSTKGSNGFISGVVDKSNTKWFLFTNHGLLKFDNKTWTEITNVDTVLKYHYFTGISVDNKNNLYLNSKHSGVAKFDQKTWKWIQIKNQDPELKHTSCIAIDGENLFYGVFQNGIMKLNLKNDQTSFFSSKDQTILSNTIMDIAIDKENNKWFATSNGVLKYDGKSWQRFDKSNSELKTDEIISISVDNYNMKWIGTAGNGVYSFNDKNWTCLNNEKNSLYSGWVEDIDIDLKGGIWLSTNEGLVNYDGNKWNVFNSKNSMLPKEGVKRTAVDSSNNIWILSYQSKIYKYSIEQNKFEEINPMSNQGDILKLLEVDKQSSIWVGGVFNGVYVFDEKKWFKQETESSSLHGTFISLASTQNFTYLGSYGCGIFIGGDKSWKNYNVLNSKITDDYIQSIKIDNNNTIWIGTLYGGIISLELKE